jgi:hypothetical protein
MPFIQRNWRGEITGVFAARQADNDEELSETHPDIVEHLSKHPIPKTS